MDKDNQIVITHICITCQTLGIAAMFPSQKVADHHQDKTGHKIQKLPNLKKEE